jgi:hypothetical protein
VTAGAPGIRDRDLESQCGPATLGITPRCLRGPARLETLGQLDAFLLCGFKRLHYTQPL